MALKDFRLRCLAKQVEKAILKYGKTPVINALRDVVNLDGHVHDSFDVHDLTEHEHEHLQNGIHQHEHVHHDHEQTLNHDHDIQVENHSKTALTTRLVDDKQTDDLEKTNKE